MATTEDEDVGEGGGDAEQEYLHDRSTQNVRAHGTGDGASRSCVGEASRGNESVEISGRCIQYSRRDHTVQVPRGVLDPEVWKDLPPEPFLMLVFARLPLAMMGSLRSLSKEWHEILSSDAFHRAYCSEVYPRVVCLLTKEKHDLFWVRALDHLRQEWHTYRIHVPSPLDDVNWTNRAPTSPKMYPACEHLGVVCFITEHNIGSKRKKAPPGFFFTVGNLVQRSFHQLPPLVRYTKMNFTKINVDKTTRAYKVYVYGHKVAWVVGKWTEDGVATLVYDSSIKEWRRPLYAADFARAAFGVRLGDEFAIRRLFNVDDDFYLRAGIFAGIAFYDGRLFLFKVPLGSNGPANDETANQPPVYFIDEMQYWEAKNKWVKVRRHRCHPFEHPRKTMLRMQQIILHACNGFLIVALDDNERFGVHLAWLYDLTTRRWTRLELPQLPVGIYDIWLMCEPQWVE